MGTLLRKALATTQLRAAFDRVHDNNGQPGVDGVTVGDFGVQVGLELHTLQAEVLGGHYQPHPLKRLWLSRPDKAPRPIGIPTVRDRVLQTAVAQVINPLLEAEFEECSFAYRQGRSVRMAVERIGVLQRQGFHWVVEADIERFFDRIPHRRLLDELRAVVKDEDLIALVGQWLIAPVQDGSRLLPVTLGVAQGSPLSPLLANLYLDHLDEALLDDNFVLVRYADDFIVLAKSRDRAEAAVELSGAVLHDLGLKLNPLKTRVVNFDTGFQFLGWNFVRSLAVPVRRRVVLPDSGRAGARSDAGAVRLSQPDAVAAPASETTQPADDLDTEMATAFADAFGDEPGWRPPRAAQSPVDSPAESSAAVVPPTTEQSAPASAAAHPLTDDGVPLPAGPEASPADAAHDDDDTPASAAEPLPSLQRTLYLVDPSVSLATENRRLIVRRDEAVVLDLPAIHVDQVMLFGRNAVTTAALVCCAQHGIPVSFLSRMGRYYGRLEPPGGEAVQLLRAQFAAQDIALFSLEMARAFVHGKLANATLLLSRYSRHRRSDADARIHNAILLHRDMLRRLKTATDLDTLRGFEGAGAAAYFAVWRVWLGTQWNFGARVKRAGKDPVNALLDLGYTLLRQAVAGLIQARGLNPWLGHLHATASGHMALASDLMEEFRPMVVDAAVLNACLNGRLTPDDFVIRDAAYYLKPDAARQFVRDIETRLNTERQHPRAAGLLDLRRIMDAQVRALAGCYRQGSAQAFEPCVFR